jgi:nitroimidazol reductase NimA-like FMN-containing flavoprotein (pyridoxamine 5'-phosphate oxidase superfamily)
MQNEPYLVSLSHGYDEARNCLYFHPAPRGKENSLFENQQQGLGANPLDYGVTDECDYAYTSMDFSGTVCLIENLADKQRAIEVVVRQLSANPEAKLENIKPDKLAKTTMGRMNIEYLTGKKHGIPKEPTSK